MQLSSRKTFLVGAILALAVGVSAAVASANHPTSSAGSITVYKTTTCGCCLKWVDHLRANGFTVDAKDVTESALVSMKRDLGVPSALESCHTAIVDGYVVEGHVPADVIQEFLEEHPKAVGLAVPGMPLGSPGMESDVKQPYNVLMFDASGASKVYRSR
jgi:hypothetical protein